MTSELRQRKGGNEAEDTRQVAENYLEQMVERSKPKPGLSNAAKKWKDKLTEDPFDLESIAQLGFCYMDDNQTKQCENIMLRGWKRVSEFKDEELKVRFLMVLCQASLKLTKFKQALAVLMDLEALNTNTKDMDGYITLKTRVYLSNNDQQKGLKAFQEGIDTKDFPTAIAIWAASIAEFKKTGLLEVTKEKVSALAQTDEDRARLDAIEKLAEAMNAVKDMATPESTNNWPLVRSAIAVTFLMVLYLLYLAEQNSLKSMV